MPDENFYSRKCISYDQVAAAAFLALFYFTVHKPEAKAQQRECSAHANSIYYETDKYSWSPFGFEVNKSHPHCCALTCSCVKATLKNLSAFSLISMHLNIKLHYQSQRKACVTEAIILASSK